jgi:hypothetical protein
MKWIAGLFAAIIASVALVEAAEVGTPFAASNVEAHNANTTTTHASFDVATGKLRSAAPSSAKASTLATCTSFPLWLFSMSRASRAFTIDTNSETAPRGWKNWAQFCWDNLSPGSAAGNEMFTSNDMFGVDNWTVRGEICRAYEVAIQKTEWYSRSFVTTQSGNGAIAGVWRHQWVFPQSILLAWGFYCDDKSFNSLYYTRFSLKGNAIATDRCSSLTSATLTNAFSALGYGSPTTLVGCF